MLLRSAAAALLALCAASPAHAYLKAGPAGYGHWLQGVIAPLDGGGAFATPAGAYSLRKLKSTYAGPALRLRRASDNAELDIGFLGFTSFTGAPLDVAAASAHCAATTCAVAKWYDQSGNARDAAQATLIAQPAYAADCGTGRPCVDAVNSNGIALQTAGVRTPVSPVTFSAVANRTAGTGGCSWPYTWGSGANLLSANGAANQWSALGGGGGTVNATAADNAWHAGIAVMNGASSVLAIDGTDTPGTTTASVAAGVIQPIGGATSTTCRLQELVIWDGYALSAAERAALTNNQRGFWGF